MIGKKFGKLTVLEKTNRRSKSRSIYYKCKCDCGNLVCIIGANLRNGHSKSCGCSKIRHGKSKTKLYDVWIHIKERCYNKNDKAYQYYGGRDITMCDEWLNSYDDFYNWSIDNGYTQCLTIDRIDNNKGYSPSNCRWVDMKTQVNNRRCTIFLTYDGKTQTMREWANELNIPYMTIYSRYKLGRTDKECLCGKEGNK